MNESIHGEGAVSDSQGRVVELIEQQKAISEVLRAIASSPHDLQPIFDAILDGATRLCRADLGSLRLSEEGDLRRVSVRGDPLLVSQAWSSYPVLEGKESFLSRLAPSGLPTHMPDLRELEGAGRDAFLITKVNAGLRTGLVVRLLNEGETVGIISIGRKEKQPFTDKEISLFGDFAAQATIALESTLRERRYREMLRQIIETVPAFLWSAGPDGEPTHVSQHVLNYSGIRFEDFKNCGWEAFVHPADFPETAKAFYRAIETGTSYQAVHRLRRAADGEYRWHHARGDPLRDERGNIIQWYGLSVDINEAKKAEDQLRRSEAYLTEAQRLSYTGSFGWTPSTGELHWSDETFRILEYDPSIKPAVERVLQRVHPDDRAMIRQLIDEASSGEKDFDVTHRLLMPDGSVKFVHVLSHSLKDAAGNLEIVGALMDVTENTLLYRDLAEREARLVERTKALSRSEAHLKEAQRLSNCGASAFNQSQIFYWSDETYRIWGFDPAQGIPPREAVLKRIYPDDRDRMRAEAERSFDEKRGPVGFRIVLPDGTTKHVELISDPMFSASGELVEVVATHADVTERMRAQEALRESERSLRSAIDGIAGLVAIFTPTGTLDALNRQVIEYFGRSLDEMKGWGTSDAIHPEDLPRIAEIFQGSMATGAPFHYEIRLRRFDGEYRWFDNRCVPVCEKSGRIARWYMLGTDIEDRKHAEQALRESEAKFRDYAETASDWFWEIGSDYKFTVLTENAFGSRPSDRIGTVCWDHALDVETEPDKWRFIRAALDSRQPFRDFVYLGSGGDGSPMYVRASGRPVFNVDGEFRGYRGTGTDVTAIVRAQEALRESERRARSAIDGIAGLVAIMTPNGELETVNRQIVEYFGRPMEWLKNWGTNDAVYPEDRSRILELFRSSIAAGVHFHFELRLRRFDGEYRWFDNRGVPIRDESGLVVRWYVLLTDIEDRTRALVRLDQMQSDLAHMNRLSMMGELAASLAHEIAQPIGTARNNARAALNFLEPRLNRPGPGQGSTYLRRG